MVVELCSSWQRCAYRLNEHCVAGTETLHLGVIVPDSWRPWGGLPVPSLHSDQCLPRLAVSKRGFSKADRDRMIECVKEREGEGNTEREYQRSSPSVVIRPSTSYASSEPAYSIFFCLGTLKLCSGCLCIITRSRVCIFAFNYILFVIIIV